MNNEPLLSISNLRTFFYTNSGIVKAVDDVSMQIFPGEIVGLLGESGSGKTALALSITKLIPQPGKIVDGSIKFKGREITCLSEKQMQDIRGKQIGMIFQDPTTFLNPLIRIGDQVAETLMIHDDLSKTEARKKAIQILEMTRIPSPDTVAKYYPHQLSGGMKQRAIIAIAIACKPSLIIADEPTTALDTIVQTHILNILQELQYKLKISILLITHDIGILSHLCKRAYVMYHGKLVEENDIVSLYHKPKHPHMQRIVAACKNIEGKNLEQ